MKTLWIILVMPFMAWAQVKPMSLGWHPQSEGKYWSLDNGGALPELTSTLGGAVLTNKPLVSYDGTKLNLQNTSTLTYSWVNYNSDMNWPCTYWVRWRRTGTRTDSSGGFCTILSRRNDSINGVSPYWMLVTYTNSAGYVEFNITQSANLGSGLFIGDVESSRAAGDWHTTAFSFNSNNRQIHMISDGYYASAVSTSGTYSATGDQLIAAVSWANTDSPGAAGNRHFVGDIASFGYIPGKALSNEALWQLWYAIERGSLP